MSKLCMLLLAVLMCSVLGCAWAGTATDRAVTMMDTWTGTVDLGNGARIEIGGGVRTEYYGYAQVDGVDVKGSAKGDDELAEKDGDESEGGKPED